MLSEEKRKILWNEFRMPAGEFLHARHYNPLHSWICSFQYWWWCATELNTKCTQLDGTSFRDLVELLFTITQKDVNLFRRSVQPCQALYFNQAPDDRPLQNEKFVWTRSAQKYLYEIQLVWATMTSRLRKNTAKPCLANRRCFYHQKQISIILAWRKKEFVGLFT